MAHHPYLFALLRGCGKLLIEPLEFACACGFVLLAVTGHVVARKKEVIDNQQAGAREGQHGDAEVAAGLIVFASFLQLCGIGAAQAAQDGSAGRLQITIVEVHPVIAAA